MDDMESSFSIGEFPDNILGKAAGRGTPSGSSGSVPIMRGSDIFISLIIVFGIL
jgi:hypothetical protein